MQKLELLQELYKQIDAGEISREEVMKGLEDTGDKTHDQHVGGGDSALSVLFSHVSVTKILYVLGAVIVLTGILFFMAQIWRDIGSFGRIIITLGLGILLTAIGSILIKHKTSEHSDYNKYIGPIFHFIGGILIPGGALVTLDELGVASLTSWPVTITFGIIFAFYLTLTYVHKHPILTLFTIANGTTFIYLFVESIVDGPFYQHDDLHAYLTMIMGVSYLLLAQSFTDGWNKHLVSILHFFGIVGLLGSAFTRIFNSGAWQALYILIVIGCLFVSVHMKSKSILVVSTLFLVGYVSYITNEYFANSLGWPISLVMLGFMFIGLGYASITINKKYIQ